MVGALDELGADAGRIEVSLPDDPPAVSVDAHQIQRALVNLIENALKYSPPGEHGPRPGRRDRGRRR